MSNIVVPEEIQSTVQRILDGRELQLTTTVALAEFIHELYKPEIEVQNFVVYKVEHGDRTYAGFRFESPLCWKQWSLVEIEGTHGANQAIPQLNTSILVEDTDVKVIERWTPEEPEIKFGIGDQYDVVNQGREVLVKGVLSTDSVDSDGDVRVEMKFSHSLFDSHYVSADVIAYAGEA